MKKEVITLANKLTPIIGDRSQAMKKAWNIVKMVARMKVDKVTFVYAKEDGTERVAIGTLNPAISGVDMLADPSKLAIKYWDLGKQWYRTFRADRFLGAA